MLATFMEYGDIWHNYRLGVASTGKDNNTAYFLAVT